MTVISSHLHGWCQMQLHHEVVQGHASEAPWCRPWLPSMTYEQSIVSCLCTGLLCCADGSHDHAHRTDTAKLRVPDPVQTPALPSRTAVCPAVTYSLVGINLLSNFCPMVSVFVSPLSAGKPGCTQRRPSRRHKRALLRHQTAAAPQRLCRAVPVGGAASAGRLLSSFQYVVLTALLAFGR